MASPGIKKKDVDTIKHWRRNPLDWVADIFPDYTPTTQQREAFAELGKLINAKLKAAKKDAELTEEEKEYARKIGVSIMSGQGTGKDCWASIVILFFLYCFGNCKIPCTAPTGHQLKDVLWAEVSKWIRKSRKLDPKNPGSPTILEHLFQWQSERIFLKEKKGKEWFAVARTVNTKGSADEQAETLAGFHEDYMLFVIDEASGVPDPVFKPIEGTLTGKLNIVLMIFNPTRSKGVAVESQYGDRDRWIPLRWNSEESEIVSREHIENMAAKYGRDSSPYRIRVLGLPPLADTDTLIPWDWIMDAVDRDIQPLEDDPVMKGVDVGAGGDKSVIATRQGGRITKLKRINTKDTMELVGWVTNEMDADNAQAAFIDVIGIGKGVYDRLRENGKRAFAVDVRRTPRDPERFLKMRDEIWWTLREQFEKGIISIPDDKDLVDQLGSIKYKPDSQGRIKVEGKEEMRKRGLHSPDEADSVCLTFAMNDNMFRPQKDEDEEYGRKRKKVANADHSNSWMYV